MGWLARLLGTEQKAATRIRSAIIGPTPLGWQLARIGGSLTPQLISAIIREADQGYMARLIDLENEARQKDCHLQAILGTREMAMGGLPFEIVAQEDAKARDKNAAVWCKERVDAIDCFTTTLQHLQGAVYHGYAVAETLWGKVDGDIAPLSFSHIAPRRFCFDEITQRLLWWDEMGGKSADGIDLAAKYPGRFIQHQPRVNGDTPCREGLGRVLMWASLFRNWTQRDWLALAELAWKPWRSGKYLKSASQEDIKILEEALDKISSSGAALLPETTELEVHFPAGAGVGHSNHGELMQWLGAEMSKATLGATTTVEQGDRGALALGKVHNEVRKDIRESDARQLAATLRRDLLTPMIRQNFGPAVQVPLFRFLTEDSIDMKAYAEAIAILQTAGLRIPTCHVYDVTGIPEPQGDEEVLEAVEVDTEELDDPNDEESGDKPPADEGDDDEPKPEDDAA
jgi:phage gp29-like protein